MRGICFHKGAKLLRQYVRKCPVYLENQTLRYRAYSMLQPIQAHYIPYHTITMDFIVGLPVTVEQTVQGEPSTSSDSSAGDQHTINGSHLPSRAILTCSHNTTETAKPGQIIETPSQPYLYNIFLTLTSYVHFPYQAVCSPLFKPSHPHPRLLHPSFVSPISIYLTNSHLVSHLNLSFSTTPHY